MKTSFTLTELHTHRGCYSKEMINYCARGLGIINLDFIIEHDEMKLTEKAWFISNHIGMTPHEHQSFALGCATIAVDMYEAVYVAKSVGRLISVTIAGKLIPCNTDATLDIPSHIRQSLTNDSSIPYAMKIAGSHTQQAAYAIYAACSRDPYDRIYSACNAIQLSGSEGLMLDYFKSFCL